MSATWRAPGRVNLIGEHTDYNAGLALPFAIDRACTATVDISDEPELTVYSAQRTGQVRVALDRIEPGIGGWAGYALGVAWSLRRLGEDVPGLQIAIDSTVPVGAGLSSSAAITCAVATAVDDLLGIGLGLDRLLALTRSVENDFVGAPTGGMDQLTALNATAEHALFCDMRTLAVDQVPLPLAATGLEILVVDSRVEHQHADGEYHARRIGCERAARALGVPALREVTMAELDEVLCRLPSDELRRYTRHVVTENDRVSRTVELMRAGSLDRIGPLLTASHDSLRDDYRVTVPELDLAVEVLLDAGGLGARMTGGGFGGSVIALLEAGTATTAADAVHAEFARHGHPRPATFRVTPSPGAHRVT